MTILMVGCYSKQTLADVVVMVKGWVSRLTVLDVPLMMCDLYQALPPSLLRHGLQLICGV
jgi:hypothetical protein